MGQYNDAENLSASIAGEVNICDIRKSESVDITFTSDSDEWGGDYTFTVFNSDKKNTSSEKANAVIPSGLDLKLTINPEEQDISVGSHYYEIYDTTTKRVEFLGALEILN